MNWVGGKRSRFLKSVKHQQARASFFIQSTTQNTGRPPEYYSHTDIVKRVQLPAADDPKKWGPSSHQLGYDSDEGRAAPKAPVHITFKPVRNSQAAQGGNRRQLFQTPDGGECIANVPNALDDQTDINWSRSPAGNVEDWLAMQTLSATHVKRSDLSSTLAGAPRPQRVTLDFQASTRTPPTTRSFKRPSLTQPGGGMIVSSTRGTKTAVAIVPSWHATTPLSWIDKSTNKASGNTSVGEGKNNDGDQDDDEDEDEDEDDDDDQDHEDDEYDSGGDVATPYKRQKTTDRTASRVPQLKSIIPRPRCASEPRLPTLTTVPVPSPRLPKACPVKMPGESAVNIASEADHLSALDVDSTTSWMSFLGQMQ